MELIKFILLVMFGYLMGNISVSRIITASTSDDITKQGSGNPGTMNMLRNHGVVKALITLLCDALKATIPAIIGAFVLFTNDAYLAEIALYVGGFSAVLGHMYPVAYGFHGGKGIACTIGVFAVANPLLALAIFVVDFVFFYFVKIGSLASMLFIISFATIHSFVTDIMYNYVAMIIMWVIVILDVFAHRANFIRLFANEERLTSFKEGVKKDLERVQDKKMEKLDELDDKEQELQEHYEEKLEKKQQKIESKKAKSMKKVAKKKVKLQQRYNWRMQQMKNESAKIIDDIQTAIDKKNQKKLEKEEKENQNMPDSDKD